MTAQRTGNDTIVAKRAPARWRQHTAAASISVLCLVWIAVLTLFGYANSAIPWCITLLVITCGAIHAGRNTSQHYAPHAVIAADNQPVSFLEASALTFIIASLTLSGWIIYHWLFKPPPLTAKRQIVDIELISLSDVQDRHDLLPGTSEKAALRKHTGTILASAGSLASLPTTKNMPQSVKPTKPDGCTRKIPIDQLKPQVMSTLQQTEAKMIVLQPLASTTSQLSGTNPVVLANPAKFNGSSKAVNNALRQQNVPDDQPFMQEVATPELVELMDNDGDNSLDTYQAGGHSQGGTGAQSDLHAYLKEINKRIKSAWSPPRGEPWQTEILFRIEKSGQLVTTRIIRASGNAEVDKAAMQAIISSAPFKAMPADYPHNFLDLHYSFNYNVDQLTELTGAQLH